MKTNLPVFALANHAEPEGLLGLANDFQITADGWVQITPFGDFPHSGPKDGRGKPLFKNGVIQRMDRSAGENMVSEFNAAPGMFQPKVKGERPWYRGHHDQDPIKYPDPNSYGWIKELANRDDGLYGKVEWTPAGQKLIDDKAFKYHSPYWSSADTGKDDDQGRRIVTPIRLRSSAFTNQPNIPVMPLSNEEEREESADRSIAAGVLIDDAVARGVLVEADRKDFHDYFNESFTDAAWALANADRSEAARKGWITRRANAAARGAAMPAKAARIARDARDGVRHASVPLNKAELDREGHALLKGRLERDEQGRAVWRKAGGGTKGKAARSPAAAAIASRSKALRFIACTIRVTSSVLAASAIYIRSRQRTRKTAMPSTEWRSSFQRPRSLIRPGSRQRTKKRLSHFAARPLRFVGNARALPPGLTLRPRITNRSRSRRSPSIRPMKAVAVGKATVAEGANKLPPARARAISSAASSPP